MLPITYHRVNHDRVYSMQKYPLEYYIEARNCLCKKIDASACSKEQRSPIPACKCECHKPSQRTKKARKK